MTQKNLEQDSNYNKYDLDGDGIVTDDELEHAKEINKTEKKVVAPTETKRARNEDGTLKADDPSTKDVNEAWEGGEAPKKTTKKTK